MTFYKHIRSFLRQADFFMSSNRASKQIVKMLNVPIVRPVHAFYDFLERKNPTDDMLQMRELSISHARDLARVYRMLEDDKSKETYKNMIIYRKTKKRKYLRRAHISLKDQYFCSDIIKVSNEEVFIDGGSFDGEDSVAFSRLTCGIYKRIYAFEPSGSNLLLLNRTIKQEKLKNIKVFRLGLWSSKDTLLFDDNVYLGAIDEVGQKEATNEIEVDSIDNVCKDEQVTFIKMDIEGAEMEALIGAKTTIQRDRPKLAVCIYHKPEDFFEIPLYIKSLVPEYKLYVRQHGVFHTETVLYAVI